PDRCTAHNCNAGAAGSAGGTGSAREAGRGAAGEPLSTAELWRAPPPVTRPPMPSLHGRNRGFCRPSPRRPHPGAPGEAWAACPVEGASAVLGEVVEGGAEVPAGGLGQRLGEVCAVDDAQQPVDGEHSRGEGPAARERIV